MTARTHIEPTTVARLVEKQMHTLDRLRASSRPVTTGGERRVVQEFVTLSRQPGSDGTTVARRLGERLGWPVFDRELLMSMAGDDRLRAKLYAALDERDQSWVEDMAIALAPNAATRDDYFRQLGKTVLSIARGSHAVFVGRGADLLLPRGCGLRVQIIEERSRRVAAYAAETHQSADEAARALRRIEADRADFIARHFHRDADDRERFDLAIKLDPLQPDDAVELILLALRRRGCVEGPA
ncbi:MAG: cytidylate kinase-like family protein [Phycisphaerae bacterium]